LPVADGFTDRFADGLPVFPVAGSPK